MSYSILDKVSVVIPTFDRPSYLFRLLDYYSRCDRPMRILVADSSSSLSRQENARIISSCSNMSIRHITFPESIDLPGKMEQATHYIDTEYGLFVADDDYVTPSGIGECVAFLEDNPDYTIAHGHYVNFRLDQDGGQLRWRCGYRYQSNTWSDPVERFLCHFISYPCTTFYGVHRTEMLRMIWGEAVKYTDDVRFGELLPSLLTLIHGKMRRVDVLYAFREAWSGVLSGRAKHISDFINEGSYPGKYAPFRECLVGHLSEKAQLSIRKSCEIVDRGMHMFHQVKHVMTRKQRKKLSMYEKLFVGGELISVDFLRGLEDPSSKYYKDFNDIGNHILRHAREGVEFSDFARSVACL